ncbi:MAG: HAMP domain-containing sensor histidine kinase [Pseudothermotoga sp.]
MLDTDWHEIVKTHRPLLLLKPDQIIFFPTNGEIDNKQQVLSDSKTFFVNAVAHELFTPITAMIGLIEIAKEGERVQEVLCKIEKHLNRMQRIIEQLVLLSKIEQEQYSPEIVHINLGKLVKDILNEYQSKVEQKKIRVSVDVTTTMKTDQEAFKIVLRNLISNAIKYSHEGGIVRIFSQQRFLVIQDEGVGVPETELKNITARFYRATNARTFSGAGLGLAIVKHILRRIDICWAIHSQVNVGTKVFIEIPQRNQSLAGE